ncbi:MAG: YeeE/YedE family protein [Methyloceanibacter sp.]|nr:YeeE/YedE family protein [Methyloceanibacter sp.]
MAEVTPFTPIASTIGGILIGVAAVLLMLFNGRIAGISGILARLFPPYAGSDVASGAVFIVGLILAPIFYSMVSGLPVTQTVSGNAVLMAVAGLLVGFGTVYGSGCTSGHGVCGLARLSRRSLVATFVFMIAGFATVFIVRHVIAS